jgi:hypothetical protein
MGKKMLFVVALFGNLTLGALGADSAAANLVRTPDAPVFILALDGTLMYEDGARPHIPEVDPWIGPAFESGGSWFGLDFGNNNKLLMEAQRLYGHKVRITGRLEKRCLGGLIPRTVDVLVVTVLKANGGIIKKSVHVEMKGRFVFRADRADILMPDSRLIVDNKTYVVNFGGNSSLWHSAVPLDGHAAIVTGTLDGDTISATAIKADSDYVHKTITVEVKGKLIWNRLPMRCMVPEFSLAAGADYFGLEFADSALRTKAEQLDGSAVIATGRLEENTGRGEVIIITALNADSSSLPDTMNVALEGNLHYVITHFMTGEVLFSCDKLPDAICRCWQVGFGVTIDGKLYQLDVQGSKSLYDQAEKFIGKPVIVNGTVNKNVVKVVSLRLLTLEQSRRWEALSCSAVN